MANERLTNFKKNVENEIQIGIKSTDRAPKLTKIIQILNAFGINVYEIDPREDEYEVLHDKEDSKSNRSISPPKMLGVPTKRNDPLRNSQVEISSNNDSEGRNTPKASINKFNSIDGK